MHYVDKYIQKNIPKNLHDYAYEVADELWAMLLALEKKGRIRPSLRGREKDFLEILMDTDKIFRSFNKFFGIYMDVDKRGKFFELFRKEFGFTNEDWLFAKREIDVSKLFEMILRHNTPNKLLVEMVPEWYGL